MLKYRHIFLWAITLNAIKIHSTVNYTPICLKIKKHLWANGLKAPALGCVSHTFFPEPLWECKQLRDAGGHPEYIIPVSNKSPLAILGPDYMSRAGPASRAPSVWAGPVVM